MFTVVHVVKDVRRCHLQTGANTDRVELLLQCLDLRLDLLQETLHSLVAADGTARRT